MSQRCPLDTGLIVHRSVPSTTSTNQDTWVLGSIVQSKVTMIYLKASFNNWFTDNIFVPYTKFGNVIPIWEGKNHIDFVVNRSKVKVTMTDVNLSFWNPVFLKLHLLIALLEEEDLALGSEGQSSMSIKGQIFKDFLSIYIDFFFKYMKKKSKTSTFFFITIATQIVHVLWHFWLFFLNSKWYLLFNLFVLSNQYI